MKRTKTLTPLGIQIKMAMVEQNVTNRELARRIDRSEATVCEVLSGKNKSPHTRRMILETLQLSEELADVNDGRGGALLRAQRREARA